MEIKLILNESNEPIGYKMIPETSHDDETIATVRDINFFGVDDTHIKYNGLELKDEVIGKEIGNIKELSWIQKKYV